MLTHRNIVFNADRGADRVTVGETDRVLSMLPLAHTFECNLGLLVPIMCGACVYYLEKPPSASLLLPAMAKVKPTMMVSVPLVIEKIHRLRVVPQLTRNALVRTLYGFPPTRKVLHRLAGRKLLATFGGHLHFFGIGGAALAPDTELFLREAKFPYTVGYGLTETSPLITGNGPHEMRFRSSGLPLPGVEVKIDDPNPDTGEGEILVRGPNVMKGYYKNPEETAKVLSEDGWLRTGDLGLFGEDGYLFIKGRLKNVIIGPSGENIYPEEIESVINELAFVEESLVYERDGRLVARVHFNYDVLKLHLNCMQIGAAEMQKCVTKFLRDLRDMVNARLNAFSRISEIVEQMEPFEKTPTHKIKRHRHVGAD
jgi:long-chain acyl-CoA synthetase